MLLEDLQVVFKMAEFRSITAAARRMLRDTLIDKSRGIPKQPIGQGIPGETFLY